MFVWSLWAFSVVFALPDAVRAQDAVIPVEAPAPAADPAPAPAAPTDAAPAAAETPAAPTQPLLGETVPPAPETPKVAEPPKTEELTPAKGTQTRWEPFDREAARTADGSLDVCSTLVFPLTFIPGVGDIVGTVGDWLCIVPAVIAVEHLGAFHGGRDSDYWQPALALVLKKVWETVLDTPIVVVTVGFLVASVGGGIALGVLGLPVTLVAAGVFGGTLAIYLALKAGRDAIGDFIFDAIYDNLTPEVEGEALLEAQREQLLQPAVEGVPAGFGLIATVAGSKPEFSWWYAIPVVGPVLKADEQAKTIQMRVRRYGREVLLEDKQNLVGVDDVSTVLATVQGYSYATAHAALGAGIVLFGSGLVVALNDTDPDKAGLQADPAAEVLGGIGLGSVALGGVAIVVGLTADKLQPVLVPAAYALAE